jgi:response regulator RpfG family c-di-GMP phosphodiesterase
MLLNILVISDSAQYTAADIQLLKDRSLYVYTCYDYSVASDTISEVKPDIIFINPEEPGKQATEMYHAILDNVLFAGIPVIYALVEDDVYLVDKKRTGVKERRNLIADNVIDAIKMALIAPKKPKQQPVYFAQNKILPVHMAARA